MRSWCRFIPDIHGEDRAVTAPIGCARISAGAPGLPGARAGASHLCAGQCAGTIPGGADEPTRDLSVTPGLQQRLEPLIAIDPGMPMQRHGHLPDARHTDGRCRVAST
jgi:hypothetical protein